MILMNELIFFFYLIIVSGTALAALKAGKEALVALVCLQWVLANLFVTKQILLFGYNVTASDALAVGATLCLNLIQEYFSQELAKKTILIGFGGTLFYTVLSWLQILYCPSAADTAHEHFCALLSPMPRLVIASLVTYLIVQLFDYKLYGWLKQRHAGSFILRNYISVGISQLIDTVIFSFLGLYGILTPLLPLIIISYGIKIAVMLLAVPFIALSRYIIK